jgi:hypothetical protein
MPRDEIYDIMKEHSKSKFDGDRSRFLVGAINKDDGKWTKHTQFHWSRMVAGKKLDYWPSRRKFQYDGTVRRGDVLKFLNLKEGQADE